MFSLRPPGAATAAAAAAADAAVAVEFVFVEYTPEPEVDASFCLAIELVTRKLKRKVRNHSEHSFFSHFFHRPPCSGGGRVQRTVIKVNTYS